MTAAACPDTGEARGPRAEQRRGAASEAGHDDPIARDDSALLAAIAAGDAAAFDALYVRCRSAALVTAHAMLQEPTMAEDAAHEAFLRVWQAAPSSRPDRGSLRAWLLTIVRNVALDVHRARQVARRPQPALAPPELHGARDEIPTAIAAADEAGRLRAALRSLPPEQRQAVELAYFAELTHAEIAAGAGIPLGTVKSRIRLGLSRLRRDLSDRAPPTSRRARFQMQSP